MKYEKWTFEKLKEEALKHKTKKDLVAANYAAYQAIKRRKLEPILFSHMPEKVSMAGENNPRFKWTKKLVLLEALKYDLKSDFIEYSHGAYKASKRLGIEDEACSHMRKQILQGEGNPNFRWPLEELQKEADKYKSKKEFWIGSHDAYEAAYNRDVLDEICKNLEGKTYWTLETATKELLNYKNRSEYFEKGQRGAYQFLVTMGAEEGAMSHMPKSQGASRPELDLFEIIKHLFPNAKKLRKRKIKIKKRPYIYGFDIDIFIPELNLGIEFDGKYHHSFEGLLRSKPLWPKSAIRNYHRIKDKYFLETHSIKILHIKEKDWNKNKENCICMCLEFLGYINQ